MLNIYCFGHFRMTYQHDNLPVTVRPHARNLLLYLLLHHEQTFQRSVIACTLWPDTNESKALKMLRRSLHELTSGLPTDYEWVLKVGSSVRWNPDSPYWLDVAEFERLSRTPQYASRAFDIYTDDLLIDYTAEWIEPERKRLRTLYIDTAEMVLDRFQQQGKLAAAIDIARQVLVYDPCQETIAQTLMQLHYQDGNRAGAIQTFEDFSEALWEELAVEPMEETLALRDEIIDETLQVPSQVDIDLPTAPFTVPAPVTSFVGRDDELLELSDLLQRTNPAHHITLLGPPGIGKTRLATEVARRLRDFYPDGVFFVSLSEISDPSQVGPAIALQVLAAADPDVKPTFEALKAHLQDRYLLLVLDNFEHVLEAGPLVSELLALSSGIQILVTSRVPLKLSEEVEFTPTLLTYPETDITLGDAREYSALVLFAERSRQRKSSFALTEDNLPIVSNICRQLDGLPLAIELVAARVGDMELAAIEQELADRFALLTSDLYNIDRRHRTLRTAIAWSVDLLPFDTQQAFAQLGVFAAGWTLDVAQQIIEDEIQVENLMATLSDHHLITRRETEFGRRFEMLVSIQEYALSLLMQTSDAYDAFQNFGSYFTNLAEEAQENWNGEHMPFWLGRLRLEEENLRRVLQWAFADDLASFEERTLYGVRLASALIRFWQAQGKEKEGLEWMERALAFSNQMDEDVRMVVFLRTAVSLQNVRRDFDQATQLLENALSIAYRTEDDESVAVALIELGTANGRQGKYAEAAPYLEQSINIQRNLADTVNPHFLATSLNNLAIVKRYLGDYEASERLLNEVVEIRKQQKDVVQTAQSLVNLGNLAITREDFLKARDIYLDALMLVKELNHQDILRSLFYGFAHIAYELNWAEHSVRISGAAVTLAQSTNRLRTPEKAKRFEEKLAELREQLGDEQYDMVFEEGAQISLEEMLDYIIETFS